MEDSEYFSFLKIMKYNNKIPQGALENKWDHYKNSAKPVKMTTLRQFTCDDLFRFNPVNLDPLTETYGVQFYLQYLARWPEYFLVAESPSNDIMGKFLSIFNLQ